MTRIIPLLVAAALSLIIGVLLAGIYLTVKIGGGYAALNTMNPFIIFDYLPNSGRLQQPVFQTSYLIVTGTLVIGIALAAVIALTGRLTTYGSAHFQDRAELRRNKMLAEFGAGLLFGRYVEPPKHTGKSELKISTRKSPVKKMAPAFHAKWGSVLISAHYDTFPNAIMVAPTGAGKTVSYVVPTCLTFPGSMVVLDVKGEIFEKTSRHRKATGDDVFRFAPLDFKNPTHQYNPIHRISRFKNEDQRHTELQKLSGYFLQSENADLGSWMKGAQQLFVAAGMLAIQRGVPTLGEIYRILFGTGEGDDIHVSQNERLTNNAEEVKAKAARQTFSKFGSRSDRQLDSYMGILEGTGLENWSNPRIEKVTRRNEIDFSTIRAKSQSVYLCVNSDDIPIMSSLIRLFFTELVAYLRGAGKLSEKEPNPVLIMLDEFDQLGHMPIFVKAIKETRGNGGRISIVTQSIPGLSTIYNEHERQSLLANCGMKIYITANERTTAKEIEADLGTRTGVSTSVSVDRAGFSFGRGTVSHNSEERPLLTDSQIRKLDNSHVILIPEKQHPILAERIEYFRDPMLQPIYDAQDGLEFPYPDEEENDQHDVQDQLNEIAKLRAEYRHKSAADQERIAELEEKVNSLVSGADDIEEAVNRPLSEQAIETQDAETPQRAETKEHNELPDEV